MIKLSLQDGKYTIHEDGGVITAKRYGKEAVLVDNLCLSLVNEVEVLNFDLAQSIVARKNQMVRHERAMAAKNVVIMLLSGVMVLLAYCTVALVSGWYNSGAKEELEWLGYEEVKVTSNRDNACGVPTDGIGFTAIHDGKKMAGIYCESHSNGERVLFAEYEGGKTDEISR